MHLQNCLLLYFLIKDFIVFTITYDKSSMLWITEDYLEQTEQ